MKFIKISIIAICVVFLGCDDDFLNPHPISSIIETDFFTNDAEVFSGVVGMYDAIQGENFLGNDDFDNENDSAGIQYEFYLTEMRSDNTFMRDPEGEEGEFNSWEINATNSIVGNYYKSYYEIIFRANRVLEFVENADEENQAGYTAEARFVRAYAYFNLVRLFGAIPLLDSLEDTETDARFIRVSTAEIYTFIEDELKEILPDLDNSYKSRASLAAAQGLLAKVNLTVKDYVEAKSFCEAIIDSNQFQLQENFQDVFYNELNSEIIFSIGYISDVVDASQGFSSLWVNETNGVNNVTTDMINAFSEDEGVNRELYSLRTTSSPIRNQSVKFLASPDSNLGLTGTAIDEDFGGNDWIVLRYADIYLMYVEAIMAGGDFIDVSNAASADIVRAKFCFEEIRRRAGVPNFEVDLITKDDLLNERRLELAFENHRFFDLVRFEEAQTVLQDYGIQLGVIEEDLLQAAVFTDFDLLLPIPEREITLSGGLMQQNLGY